MLLHPILPWPPHQCCHWTLLKIRNIKFQLISFFCGSALLRRWSQVSWNDLFKRSSLSTDPNLHVQEEILINQGFSFPHQILLSFSTCLLPPSPRSLHGMPALYSSFLFVWCARGVAIQRDGREDLFHSFFSSPVKVMSSWSHSSEPMKQYWKIESKTIKVTLVQEPNHSKNNQEPTANHLSKSLLG